MIIPDPTKREESWENISKGIESRFFVDAVRRCERLLADMEGYLAEESWLAGKKFSLAIPATLLSSGGCKISNCSFCGQTAAHIWMVGPSSQTTGVPAGFR